MRKYFVYFKSNQRHMAEKDLSFGHVGIFQTSPFSREANGWLVWTLWAKAARSTGSASGLGEGLLLSGLGAQEASRVRHGELALAQAKSAEDAAKVKEIFQARVDAKGTDGPGNYPEEGRAPGRRTGSWQEYAFSYVTELL